jgi:hypothetical protein
MRPQLPDRPLRLGELNIPDYRHALVSMAGVDLDGLLLTFDSLAA